jgi:hypothetical protein
VLPLWAGQRLAGRAGSQALENPLRHENLPEEGQPNGLEVAAVPRSGDDALCFGRIPVKGIRSGAMRKSIRFKIHNNVVQQSGGKRISNLTLHSPITVNAVLLLSQETWVRHFRGLPPI